GRPVVDGPATAGDGLAGLGGVVALAGRRGRLAARCRGRVGGFARRLFRPRRIPAGDDPPTTAVPRPLAGYGGPAVANRADELAAGPESHLGTDAAVSARLPGGGD